MEPKLPRPNLSPEAQPTAAPEAKSEVVSTPVERSPEVPETGHEQKNAISDDSALQAATQAAPAVPAPLPSVPQQQSTSTNDDSTNPTVASDEDKIEKEWVDKAKKVVAETKEDPHKQSYEVSKMQVDYLNKRFGKQLNLPNDS